MKKLLQGICPVDNDVEIFGICNDSRRVVPGDLFLATIGNTVDGRAYIADAIQRGAAAVVYEEDGQFQPPDCKNLPILPTRDLSQWEGVIASRFYRFPSTKMDCVGVTGTNGKTSCTQWLAAALQREGIPCGVVGTLGFGFPPKLKTTGYTTPDPIQLQQGLAELHSQGAKAVAIEVSSHALAQYRLNGMHFDLAVLTQLSHDHLDYHGTMECYARVKARLFQWEGLNAAIINIDDPFGSQWSNDFSKKYPVITYSLRSDSNALIRAQQIEPQCDGFLVRVATPWGEGVFQSPFLGEFNVSNLLAVLAVLGCYDVPFKTALQCVESLTAIPGRMERFGSEDQPTVIVDYSHTPDALKNALLALRQHCRGTLWCVFGCGGDRDRGKRAEMAAISEKYADWVVVTSDNPRTESPQQIVSDIILGFSGDDIAVVEPDRAAAIAYAIQSAVSQDTVLIAGKGHENHQIIGNQVLPFSDVAHVVDQLARKERN